MLYKVHLTPEEMVDAAEGRRAFAHLESCAGCRRQVLEFRQTIAAASDVEMPEPSPLFWEHFANRVQAAIAAEKIAHDSWWRLPSPGHRAVIATAVAVVVIAAAISLRAPQRPIESSSGTTTVTATLTDPAAATDQEAAFQLIADLSSDLDWDAASEAGLMPSTGWVETVLSELNDTERAALQRLLNEEIKRSGA